MIRVCKKCKLEKDESEFYSVKMKNGSIYNRYTCKVCFYNRMNENRIKRKKENKNPELELKLYLEDQVTAYHQEPNRYKTEEQKHNVFVLMTIMGWNFKDGVWYKPGVKEEGNFWPGIHIKKNGEYLLKVPYKKYNPQNKRNDLRSPEVLDEIIRLKDEGATYEELRKIFGASCFTLRVIYINEKAKRKTC